MSIKITKKSMKAISLKELLDMGKLDRIISSRAGGYLGETLEQIIMQKLEDLKDGELYYEQEITDGKCTEGEKTPVCLWSLDSRSEVWLRDKLSEDNMKKEIYVVFGLTDSKAKSSCETADQDEQNYVKKIILPEHENVIYPENYHKEYINENKKSMAFLVSDLYVAKENIYADEIKKYYKAYFANGNAEPLNRVHSQCTYAYAEIENREGLESFLNEKQDTISDCETGVIIAKLIYPYVASVS